MRNILDQPVNLIRKVEDKVVHFLIHSVDPLVLILCALCKLLDISIYLVDHLLRIFCIFFELINLLSDLRRCLQSLLNLVCKILLVGQNFANLALRAPDRYARIVQLRLEVFCLRYMFFDGFGEGWTFLRSQLVYETATKAVCIDVILVEYWHLVVAVLVSHTEMLQVYRWYQ